VKKDKINITRFGQDQLRKRKKKWIKPVIIGIVLTAIFAFLALKSEDIIHTNIVKLSVDNDANATWIGSLAPSGGTVKQFKIADEPKFIDGKAEQLFYPIYLSITNIGNGFANTMTFGTGENLTGLSYKEVFTINETKVVKLDVQTYKMSKGVSFFIWFADSMTNEYIQYYELNRDSSGTGYELDIGYPNLIE
jgi:hypothetical protein